MVSDCVEDRSVSSRIIDYRLQVYVLNLPILIFVGKSNLSCAEGHKTRRARPKYPQRPTITAFILPRLKNINRYEIQTKCNYITAKIHYKRNVLNAQVIRRADKLENTNKEI